ncbi:MAG: hypothetical protein IBX41_05355 [Methanophagales archaeon]|nr:hypothetical protein [Methanophagales archaeon]
MEKVYAEAYKKIVDILSTYPDARLTVNISATLTEQLQKYRLTYVLDKLVELGESKQIEFTGSAKFHPIIPLIHAREAERQITLNEEANREILGSSYRPKGFFLPEMCYSRSAAEIVEKLKYEWLIIDEIAYTGRLGSLEAKQSKVYKLRDSKLKIFFKNRRFSGGITYGSFPNGADFLSACEQEGMGREEGSEGYLLTGTDGEVYGHHRKGQEKLLIDLFKSKSLETATLSELLDTFELEETEPVPSSWSTWEDELEADIPYPQWKFPGNIIHKWQWRLAELATTAIHQAEEQGEVELGVRSSLDEGLHSCQWWWASCRPWWDVGMIKDGVNKLISAVRGVKSGIDERFLSEAEWLAKNIVTYAWDLHERRDAHRLQKEYLQTHTGVASLLTFGPGEER